MAHRRTRMTLSPRRNSLLMNLWCVRKAWSVTVALIAQLCFRHIDLRCTAAQKQAQICGALLCKSKLHRNCKRGGCTCPC